MSTTPTPAPATGFWTKFKAILPALEMAGNVALLATPFAAFEPLVAGLETDSQSLVNLISTKPSVQTETMALFASSIGILTTLKAQPGLPAATLTQIDGYITAAEAGTAAYIQAESGFSAANYQPVTPIA
jgi:hypothetical protein